MRRLTLLLAFAAGCEGSEPEDTDAVTCTDAPTSLGIDEVSPLGFSGADIVALVDDYPLATGRWSVIDETAQVQIHGEGFESAVYHERTTSDGSADAACVSTLDIEGRIQIESYAGSGGADIWPTGAVSAATLDAATVTATITGEGAYVADAVTGIVAEEYENIVFTLTNDWTFAIGFDATLEGTLAVDATKISDGQAYSAVLLTWPD